MQQWITQGKPSADFPTVHVVSDSVGATAQTVVRAVSASFGVYDPAIEILPRVSSCEEMLADVESHLELHKADSRVPFVLFYTLVSSKMRACMRAFADENADDIIAVDLMGDALGALSRATGRDPIDAPGAIHSVNEYYFRRIDAMEFTISHDDGRNPPRPHRGRYRADRRVPHVEDAAVHLPLAVGLSRGQRAARPPERAA